MRPTRATRAAGSLSPHPTSPHTPPIINNAQALLLVRPVKRWQLRGVPNGAGAIPVVGHWGARLGADLDGYLRRTMAHFRQRGTSCFQYWVSSIPIVVVHDPHAARAVLSKTRDSWDAIGTQACMTGEEMATLNCGPTFCNGDRVSGGGGQVVDRHVLPAQPARVCRSHPSSPPLPLSPPCSGAGAARRSSRA